MSICYPTLSKNIFSLASRYTLLASCILSGCIHPEEAKHLLPGVWEGSSAVHTWCASYSENHALHVQIKILTQQRPNDKSKIETPVVHSYGRWDLEHGPRLLNTMSDNSATQENANPSHPLITTVDDLKAITPFSTPNFTTSSYIITSIDQNKMEYVEMNDREKKYVSRRVSSCSDLFST